MAKIKQWYKNKAIIKPPIFLSRKENTKQRKAFQYKTTGREIGRT
jgi:hypothetical protein